MKAEQLTFQALLERTPAEPEPKSEASVPTPPPPPADPLESDLFTGAPMLRARLVAACAALDAPAARQVHSELVKKFHSQEWAKQTPAWAAGIEWLVEPVTALEQTRRALELLESSAAARRFPQAPEAILRPVRRAALGRAAQRLIDEGGPAARLPDGRPAALLALLGGDGPLAVRLLSAACAEQPNAGWFVNLAEAATLAGDAETALLAWCRAGLVDPGAVDVARVETPAVLDLLDQAEDLELPAPLAGWVPVLADLIGLVMLDDLALRDSPQAHASQTVAKRLREFRKQRGALEEKARVALKRELVRAAPEALRELLRPL